MLVFSPTAPPAQFEIVLGGHFFLCVWDFQLCCVFFFNISKCLLWSDYFNRVCSHLSQLLLQSSNSACRNLVRISSLARHMPEYMNGHGDTPPPHKRWFVQSPLTPKSHQCCACCFLYQIMLNWRTLFLLKPEAWENEFLAGSAFWPPVQTDSHHLQCEFTLVWTGASIKSDLDARHLAANKHDTTVWI